MKKIFFLLIIFAIFCTKLFSQDSKPFLKLQPVDVKVFYKDLITNDNGVITKNQDELVALNKLIQDSTLYWAKKYEVNTAEGFEKYAHFLGNKLQIPAGKKIDIDFISKDGKEEFFFLWSMANGIYKFEKTQKPVRNR